MGHLSANSAPFLQRPSAAGRLRLKSGDLRIGLAVMRQYELVEVIDKYKDKCGYEMPELSVALEVFLRAYADEDNLPGCFDECANICKVEGIRELLDLRMLAKRTFLGDYFPAKVALRFENAFESPKVEKVFNESKGSPRSRNSPHGNRVRRCSRRQSTYSRGQWQASPSAPTSRGQTPST